jgi:small-conductance mechanosensitive channel
MVQSFHAEVGLLRQRLKELGDAFPRIYANLPLVVEKLTGDGPPQRATLILAAIFGIFLGAYLIEWIIRRTILKKRKKAEEPSIANYKKKFVSLSGYLALDIFSIAVFSVFSFIFFFSVYQDDPPVRLTFLAFLLSIIFTRLVAAGSYFVFSPARPECRLLPLSDQVARRLARRLIWIGAVISFTFFLLTLLFELGFDPSTEQALAVLAIWGVVLVICVMLWQERHAIANAVRGNRSTGHLEAPPSTFARNAYLIGIAYLLIMGLVATGVRLMTDASILGQFLATTALLFAIPLLDWVARLGIEAGVGRMVRDADGSIAADGSDEDRIHYYTHSIHGNVRIILGVLILFLFARIWGIDLQESATSYIGESLAGSLFEIILTIILASALWGMIKCALRHYADKADEAADSAEAGEIGGKGKSRLATLVPLFGNFLLIVLIVLVSLIILSALGVNIGPLLAGAGVVGLALGFGAQTLVRDIISGVFFLMDDAFRVGEYVDVGGVRGAVERISLRSLQLRHHNGPLNTIPFGEIGHLTNYSRDWAIMKLELRLSFDTDLEKVRKIIKKVGQSLADDPVHGPNFLQPVKSQGVHHMDDSAFIIRVKFMAKPGQQFTLRREVFRQIQEALAEQGIHFAPRRVIVDTSAITGGEDQEATPSAGAKAAVLAAAAAGAAASTVEGPEPDGPSDTL